MIFKFIFRRLYCLRAPIISFASKDARATGHGGGQGEGSGGVGVLEGIRLPFGPVADDARAVTKILEADFGGWQQFGSIGAVQHREVEFAAIDEGFEEGVAPQFGPPDAGGRIQFSQLGERHDAVFADAELLVV